MQAVQYDLVNNIYRIITYLKHAILPTIENTVVTVRIIILLSHIEEKVAGEHSIQSVEIGVDSYC